MIERHNGLIHITVTANATRHESDHGETWQADQNDFWEAEDAIDLDAVLANPAGWLEYLTTSTREGAKQHVQQIVDRFREGTKDEPPVVPVPSFRPGAAVCHRPGDDTKLLGGLILGGLDLFELADGTITPLTEDDIRAIIKDAKDWETKIQVAKHTANNTIDASTRWEQITAAIAQLESTLDALRP